MASLDEIRERLRELPDPLEFLVKLFALSPVPHLIYNARGDCILANEAIRKLYGGLPPPGFNVFRDQETQRTGIIPQIRRAFAGETVEIPPHWYDARAVEPGIGRRVAVASTVFPLTNAAGEVTHVAVAFKDVTEELLAREAAETERDRLRLIVEQSGDGIVVADEDGVVRIFNAEAQRLYGVPMREVPVSEWTRAYGLETTDGQPLPAEETALYKAMRGTPVANARWQVRHADGTRRTLSGTASPLRRADGAATGAVLTVRDETSRQELLARERQARATAERFAALLDAFIEAAPVQFGIVDSELRFVRVNPALAAGNGKPIEEHLGRTLSEVLPRVAAVVGPAFQRVLDTGKAILNFPASIEPLATPGQFRHAHISLFPIELPEREGRMVGIVVMEITDQVRARETIENQQKWLEAVFDLMPMPVIMVEPGTGRFLLTNQAASELYARMFQANDGGVITADTVVVTDGEGRRLGSDQMLSARAARGEEFNADEMTWHTLGGEFDLLISARQLPAMYGHQAAAIAPFQDVTRLKKVERELKEAVRTRDAFLSIASHELKTPLTSMKLNLQGARRFIERGREDALDATRITRMLEQSDRQIDRLTRLVDDMLDVSRLATGKLTIHREPFDLSQLARDTVDRLYPLLEKAHCPVKVDAPDAVRGEWDLARIEQVLVNLLSNAARYGAGRPIEVQIHRESGQAVVSVRDHGRGIAPADQSRIFEQYERAVSAREISGMGLGLFISKQIVTMHGGVIAVESTPGEGARFTVRLPLELPAL